MESKGLLFVMFLLLGHCIISEGLPAVQKGCPNPVNCFVAPCQFAKCSVPNAECRDDYCGGCFARWYLGIQEVTNRCSGQY